MKTVDELRADGLSYQAIAEATGLKIAQVKNLLNHVPGLKRTMMRHAPIHSHPSSVAPDNWNRPAVIEGRTQFPTRVIPSADRKRLLISGVNNSKTGAMVTKGEWVKMPIYTLTLEERATCSSHCFMYAGCYGNSMHFAPRTKNDADLIPRLDRELHALATAHPNGFVVRLHILGDFFSPEYAWAWATWLAQLPELHVFGYTARSHEHDARIWAGIARMNIFKDRCFIRVSSAKSKPGGATVIGWLPDKPRVAEGIVCPAQTSKTIGCASCGLCWASEARDETIVFIKHGPVLGRRVKS